jgi:hypothetical protein
MEKADAIANASRPDLIMFFVSIIISIGCMSRQRDAGR